MLELLLPQAYRRIRRSSHLLTDMNISVSSKKTHVGLAFVSAAAGGCTSLGVLKLFEEWAFTTELNWWLMIIGSHAFLLFCFLTIWFWNVRSDLTTRTVAIKSIGAIFLGAFVSIFGVPGYSYILIYTGHAFISSGIATVMYVVMAAFEVRYEGTD